jgi:hypothetical protein
MGLRITGLDKFQQKLRDLSNRAQELSQPQDVPLTELLNEAFVSGCSKFASFADLVAASGCDLTSAESFQSPQWNAFVGANTRFANWTEMVREASRLWFAKQLRT